jgi:hypothetical protein
MPIVEIEISGDGGEFQHHLLEEETLRKVMTASKKINADDLVSEFFDGGRLFDKTPEPGIYGSSSKAKIKVGGKQIKPGALKVVRTISDKSPTASGGNFYYIAQGKVEGAGTIEISGKFDPSLLEVEVVRYELLEGWKSGELIEQLFYDGKEIDIEWTDSGLNMRHVLCFYKVDKKGNYKDTDIALMYDEGEDGWAFDEEPIELFLKN